MAAIITKDTRLHNARQFVEAFNEQANTIMYVFLGKPTNWPIEYAPPIQADTYKGQADTWNNMEVMKAATENDVTHAIPRNNWKAGNVYFQYNDNIESANLFDAQYFVMNSEYNVYKCLSNSNGNVTTTEPTGTGSAIDNLVINNNVGQDQYVWKFMYNIPPGTWVKFGTTSFIPVLDTSAAVKLNAANTRGIYGYNVLNANIGSSSPFGPLVSLDIVGDGTLATATALIVNGNIANVYVGVYGNNYTVANITTNLGNAVIQPIVAPPDGHGYDSVDELGGLFAMVNVRFEQSDFPLVPIEGFKFRQVGLLKDPYLRSTNGLPSGGRIPTKTSANSILTAYSNIVISGTISNPGQILSGATLRGGTTGANATVVSYLGNVINYVKSDETSANAAANYKPFSSSEQIYIGNYLLGTSVSLGNSMVQPRSGEIVYIDNRNVITRATDQVEDVFVVLEF